MVFICPICKKKLENTVHAYCCENGHSYDVSAQGYVHLLPPNKMHSKIPGDNRQMVACRREFLKQVFTFRSVIGSMIWWRKQLEIKRSLSFWMQAAEKATIQGV